MGRGVSIYGNIGSGVFQVWGYKIKFILPKSEHGNCLEQRNFQPTTWSCRHRKIKVSWVVEFLFMQFMVISFVEFKVGGLQIM